MTTRRQTIRNLAKDNPDFAIADHASHGDVVLAEVEKAYRRGYTQGWSAARQTMQYDGATLQDIEAHETTLMKWRIASVKWFKGLAVLAYIPPRWKPNKSRKGK